jgi:hypothetical protein
MKLRTLLVLFCALSITISGCGSGKKEEGKAQKPSKPKAEKPAPEVTFDQAQLEKLVNGMYPVLSKDAAAHGNYFANTPTRMRSVNAQLAALARKTLTQYPKGPGVMISGWVGSMADKRYVGCRAAPVFGYVTDREGRAILIFLATDTDTFGMIYDYRKAGKTGFDKSGFKVVSAPCAQTEPPPAATADEVVQLDRQIPKAGTQTAS